MGRTPDHRGISWNEAPRYLIRDRDQVYGAAATRRLRAMGIRDKPVAPGSPWHAFAERLIVSIRRECVDHIVVLGEKHLRAVVPVVNLIRWRGRTNRVMLSPDVGRLQIDLVAADRAVPIESDT
jgi:hypothetical protein